MIDIYCRHHLHCVEIPDEYNALAEYAAQRLEHCRYGEDKPACKVCPVHCYKPEMRERMRRVMRWAGPRMIIYSPLEFFRHILQCRD